MIDMNKLKKIVVFPAYNAEKTLEKTVNDIPPGTFDEMILVDDCSNDGTYEIAVKLGIKSFRHEKNKGYGANQKTCYKIALEHGADIVVMIHPDYQYDPRITHMLVEIIEKDICDVVLGNRIRTRLEALNGGMPFYKYISNRFLTAVENFITGQNLGEWHSGLRAYSRRVLETVHWNLNSNDFVFDAQFLAECAWLGFRVGDIPVSAKYFKEASSIHFARGVIYGLSSLSLMGEFMANKTGFIKTAKFGKKAEYRM
jgi:glycosyltransferase involved in cell wall biosynthesis